MDEDERTIDDLIEIAEEIPDKLGIAAGMAELRGTARGEHVAVTVDVQGMLVDLRIDDEALALGPEGLAAEISRLSTEAGTSVLRDGLKAIRAGCGPVIADAVGSYLGIEETDDTGDAAGTDSTDEAGKAEAAHPRQEPARVPVAAGAERPRRAPGRVSRPASPDDDEPDEFVLRPV